MSFLILDSCLLVYSKQFKTFFFDLLTLNFKTMLSNHSFSLNFWVRFPLIPAPPKYLTLMVSLPHDIAFFVLNGLSKFLSAAPLNYFHCIFFICCTFINFFLFACVFVPFSLCYRLFKLLFKTFFFDLLNCIFNIQILHLKYTKKRAINLDKFA